ncbi:MAG: DUF1330 domain-containing protein [Alphaproteobacteria bacterium]|nr:DUF1330 domain-containing protein [Alphaproteobacteria bacterium]MDP6565893.1 DUF1330 domain-containing protein [Alphaproteobacteria bacterium]MDP6813719.1 DUF1330 domain-containing protein [Alphaproteobacteria bacterium]
MYLDPTDEQLQEIAELPDEGPVVMLNLLKFNEQSADGQGSGWDAYVRYSEAVIGLIKRRGGDILWAGAGEAVALGGEADGDWDYVALVQYPSRKAFVEMMQSAEYAAANHHRLNAAARHTILAVTPRYSKLN